MLLLLFILINIMIGLFINLYAHCTHNILWHFIYTVIILRCVTLGRLRDEKKKNMCLARQKR